MPSIRLSDLLAEEMTGQPSCSPTWARSRFIGEKSQTLADLSGTWLDFRAKLLELVEEFEETVADDLDRQSMAIARADIDAFHDMIATRILPLGNQ